MVGHRVVVVVQRAFGIAQPCSTRACSAQACIA